MENLTCKYCGKICKTAQGKSYHQNRCKQNSSRTVEKKPQTSYPTTICSICGKIIRNCNIDRHIKAHESKNSGWHLSHDGLICMFCGKELGTRNALAQHEIRCRNNPDRIDIGVIAMSNISWNKGLTKETDERVRRGAENVKRTFDKMISDGWVPGFAKYWGNPDHRKEQSEKKKRLYAEHPEKHPNRKLSGNRSQMSYPERTTFDWLTDNDIDFQHQYRTLSFNDEYRYVDFYLPEFSLFIEVDGEYWHKDCAEEDAKKDEFALQKYGIKTFRIHPKENIQKQLSKILFDK